MKTAPLILTVLLWTAMSAQAQEPTTGYAPVNGLDMYYEIHGSGSGEPLVLLHGSFMTITNNWTGWIGELSKRRKVIAVEMQGHGRTADINRDFSYIHGDADGVRLDHIAEMFRLEGGEIFGDMRPRSQSRLAVLPNTTHITLMEKSKVIVPMVNDFLDAEAQNR